MARYIDADALADEIVNTLKRRDYASDSHTYACFKKFIEILDEAPTADVVEVKWTNVDEKLPEKADWYLVYAENQRPFVAYFKGKTFPLNNHYHKITHWMPLPEPPKEGADNGL